MKISALRAAPVVAICSKPMSSAFSSVGVFVSMPIPRAQVGKLLKYLDLLAEFLRVDRARGSLRLGFVGFCKNLVEQVVLNLFSLDQLFGELRVVLCADRRAESSSRMRNLSSVAAMACEDEARSLRRISAVKCRCRRGSA